MFAVSTQLPSLWWAFPASLIAFSMLFITLFLNSKFIISHNYNLNKNPLKSVWLSAKLPTMRVRPLASAKRSFRRSEANLRAVEVSFSLFRRSAELRLPCQRCLLFRRCWCRQMGSSWNRSAWSQKQLQLLRSRKCLQYHRCLCRRVSVS